MFSMYLKMNLGRQSWRHPFRVISPWMFFCSMGRALMPWTSGSSPLCTRLPPRIAWKCVPCCWVTEPIPRWSTAMGRARWTWPRPQNSKRGSHVSLYSIYRLIKQPCSLLLKSELKTTYWDLSPFLSTSGIKANKTHPAVHLASVSELDATWLWLFLPHSHWHQDRHIKVQRKTTLNVHYSRSALFKRSGGWAPVCWWGWQAMSLYILPVNSPSGFSQCGVEWCSFDWNFTQFAV